MSEVQSGVQEQTSQRGHGDQSRRRRGRALTVVVDERGVDAALRVFKKLILKEGLLKDIKRHAHYEKPGDRRRRKVRESARRLRKQRARALQRGEQID